MTTEQRLNRLEDEFETVKELLMSAARYAESANSGLDLLTERVDHLFDGQERTQAQLDQLTSRVDHLFDGQERTQAQLDQLTSRVDHLFDGQERTQAQLDQLTEKVDRLSDRVDSFVFEAGRLFAQNGERLTRAEGQSERLVAVVQMLERNYSAQQSQLREFQQTTNATLERIDRILDFLLRQNRGDQA